MGFLKDWSDYRKKKKQKKAEKAKNVNQNPTEEELKNNKKGKLSYLWTLLSIVAYVLAFGIVAKAWEMNFAVGIIALIMMTIIASLVHRKAISLAQEQRKINGKGLFALLLASFLPLVVLAGGVFFFLFGGMYF